MNTQVNFDILYLINNLKDKYDFILENELQNLLYLASLLSVFDGNPSTSWGYFFMNLDGRPFNEEIPFQLDEMNKKGILRCSNHKYTITSFGSKFLNGITNFSNTAFRKKYLNACCEALLTIPLPLLTNSINKESMIQDLSKMPRRELLGQGISIKLLYKDFSILKDVLGNDVTDLWIVSTLWIRYLINLDNGGKLYD